MAANRIVNKIVNILRQHVIVISTEVFDKLIICASPLV